MVLFPVNNYVSRVPECVAQSFEAVHGMKAVVANFVVQDL